MAEATVEAVKLLLGAIVGYLIAERRHRKQQKDGNCERIIHLVRNIADDSRELVVGEFSAQEIIRRATAIATQSKRLSWEMCRCGRLYKELTDYEEALTDFRFEVTRDVDQVRARAPEGRSMWIASLDEKEQALVALLNRVRDGG